MAYIAPSTRSAGALITATIWNQDVVANPIALNAGAFSLSGQAAMDDMYASSTTQWAVGRRQLRQTFRGLNLRTHPDADVAASKVFLYHADEIVMHDGTSVLDWNDLVADITVAGANGLDTGAETASVWYQIHAIRKSSDGTKGLMLHRAKDYFLDEQNTTATTTSALRDGAGQTKRAQTFDVDVTGPCEKVEFKFTKNGSPTGQFWVSIYATSGGLPTGAALKTSDKMNVAVVATTEQVITMVFRDPATLTAGTTYAAVLEGNFTISGSNYLSFARSTTDPYAAGQLCAFDGTTWAGSSVDAWFKVYITQNDTALTMPSGYDQYALIGWVYNDSGSDFDPFVAKDRDVCTQLFQAIAASSVSILTLASLVTAVPPITCIPKLQISAGSGGSIMVIITGVPDGFGNSYNRTIAAVAADYNQDVPGMVTEFQGLYGYRAAGSGTFDIRVIGYEW